MKRTPPTRHISTEAQSHNAHIAVATPFSFPNMAKESQVRWHQFATRVWEQSLDGSFAAVHPRSGGWRRPR